MSAYDEQEDLEKLKKWWKDYGSSAITGILLGAAFLAGFRFWTQYNEEQLHTAAGIYERMFQNFHGTNPAEAHRLGESLVREYASTPYAGMAGLLLARLEFESGDSAKARQHLQWVLDKADDTAVRHVARLRLARILLDGGDKEAALALLNVTERPGFEAEYAELEGDIHLARGQRDAARSAYREALKYLTAGSPYAAILRMKFDDLGPEQNS
ncbi:MAG: tetratricopeptide repeat protein [Gammaproteobacteria bacterium]|nr:tetratricopeptide repeat protein [Gammaproteobacteria bacterium]